MSSRWWWIVEGAVGLALVSPVACSTPPAARAPSHRTGCTLLPHGSPAQSRAQPSPPEPAVPAWRRQILADVLWAGAECQGSEDVLQRSTDPDQMVLRQPPHHPYARLPPMDPWTFLCEAGGGYAPASSRVLDFRLDGADVLVCVLDTSVDHSAPATVHERRCQALSEVRRFGSVELRWGGAPARPGSPRKEPPGGLSSVAPSGGALSPVALPAALHQRLTSYVDCLGSSCGCGQHLASR